MENVQTGRLFDKLHDGAVEAVNKKGRLGRGVKRDSAHLLYVGHGKNVGDGLRIITHGSKVGEIADVLGVLRSAIGKDTEDVIASADVR